MPSSPLGKMRTIPSKDGTHGAQSMSIHHAYIGQKTSFYATLRQFPQIRHPYLFLREWSYHCVMSYYSSRCSGAFHSQTTVDKYKTCTLTPAKYECPLKLIFTSEWYRFLIHGHGTDSLHSNQGGR